MKKLIVFFILIICLSVSANKYQDLMTFSRVFNILKKQYVEEVDSKILIYGAIKGMLNELDPYTSYLTHDMYQDFKTETSGNFGGVGIELTIRDDFPVVISPIEDSPAWDAGIKAGDKIISINGTSTKGLRISEISRLVKGKLGSKLSIKVEVDKDTVKQFKLKRKIIKAKSVKYHSLDDGIAYLRIASFTKETSRELKKI